jgi:hypothetical protein
MWRGVHGRVQKCVRDRKMFTKGRMHVVFGLAVCGGFLVPPAGATGLADSTARNTSVSDSDGRSLLDIINDANIGLYPSWVREVESKAFDSNEQAVPQLVKVLETSQSEARLKLTAMALAYIGNAEAVTALERIWQSKKDPFVGRMFFFSLPKGERAKAKVAVFHALGASGPYEDPCVRESVIFAAGVIRLTEAVFLLDRFLKPKRVQTVVGPAAENVSLWLRHGPYAVDLHVPFNHSDIIASIVSNGVPRMGESARFYEGADDPRLWTRVDNGWRVESVAQVRKKAPQISFQVIRSKDMTRALVTVRVYFGPINASCYVYVLRREASGWRVVGMTHAGDS